MLVSLLACVDANVGWLVASRHGLRVMAWMLLAVVQRYASPKAVAAAEALVDEVSASAVAPASVTAPDAQRKIGCLLVFTCYTMARINATWVASALARTLAMVCISARKSVTCDALGLAALRLARTDGTTMAVLAGVAGLQLTVCNLDTFRVVCTALAALSLRGLVDGELPWHGALVGFIASGELCRVVSLLALRRLKCHARFMFSSSSSSTRRKRAA